MNNRFMLLTVVAALALAGCADQNGGTPTTTTGASPGTTPTGASPTTTTGTTPTPTGGGSTDDAEALFSQAIGNIPPQYGMAIAFSKDGAEVMTITGAFDNETETGYFEVTADAQALGTGGDAETAALLENGFAAYVTPEGAYYLIGDMVFVFSGDTTDDTGYVPSPEDAFGDFLDPTEMFGSEGEDIEILSRSSTTWKGQAAEQFEIRTTDEEGVVSNGTVIFYTSPSRPAHMEAEVPEELDEETGMADPMTGGTATIDFLYGDEVVIKIPENAERALGLAYHSDAFANFGMGSGEGAYEENWTFVGDAGITLASIEVHLKEQGEGDSNPTGISSLPTVWTMGLDEGSHTEGGVTVGFMDEDGSGTVSPGDVLHIISEDGTRPNVVLFDTVVGVYVVPGAGFFALVGALGAALLLVRRK